MERLLIVDPDPSEQHRVSQIVQTLWPDITIKVARTLRDGLQELANLLPNLIVCELHLPDGEGLEILEQVQHRHPQSHRVVFTHLDGDSHVFSALSRGVDGYLLKEEGDAGIRRMLEMIGRGESALSATILRQVMRYFENRNLDTPSASEGEEALAESIGLTPREIEVLRLLSWGYDRHQVASALYIKPSTVAGHIKAIYLKLNVSTRAEATLAAVKLGLVEVQD